MTSTVNTSSPWLRAECASNGAITRTVTDPMQRRPGTTWYVSLVVALLLSVWFAVTIGWILIDGIGAWGINTTVVWGFAIANYVWWIGIGNAGTLISSMLLLTRQPWRATINRFAEAMTLCAVAIAGIMPIIHLGRPIYFYWLAPYPNTMDLWPQWRSALVWDFWAIASYLLFSILFWYHGLIPDLATMRDRAQTRMPQLLYGIAAMGWRGSICHWQSYKILHSTLAALAVPLVCSVHSIVGLDFAASLEPGWNEGLFPPYFVVGAMYSGFAMVVVLCAALRWGFSLECLITHRHFDAMAKMILAASIVMGLSYATLYFMAWYGADETERDLVRFYFFGTYAPIYWLLLVCNVGIPQVLWLASARANLATLVLVAIVINVGMWIERILIVWTTLSHDYAVSLWRSFQPTFWDWSLLISPFGIFLLFFLVTTRLVPPVSMSDTRELAHREAAR